MGRSSAAHQPWWVCTRCRPPARGLTETNACCSQAVGPRNPWGKDPALDYDVMSDMEWEEEPDGESLSVRLGLHLLGSRPQIPASR